MKKFKKMEVQTDCGIITVEEYDDGLANGINIYLNGDIVAVVDCYRKKHSVALPKSVYIAYTELLDEIDIDEQIANYLSNKYGYCVNSFTMDKDTAGVCVRNIDWDIDVNEITPEARLLTYEPDCDEPKDCIIIN